MNNPLNFVQIMRNPQDFMQKCVNDTRIMQNPIAKNALEMYQKGDKDGVNQLAENLCKEKGINRQDFEKQIMSQIGMN